MLLGHWGTTPGQNFIYVHLNRIIKKYDLDMIYISGPGHGGPALVGQHLSRGHLQRNLSQHHPRRARTAETVQAILIPRRYSQPCFARMPGSIHEGGELGYSLSHAFGAVFDNPDLIVACVVGDGEAETGPLATAWHSNKFLDPATDGAVLPILHLNGYKIANPTILARIPREELQKLLRGLRLEAASSSRAMSPSTMHQAMAAALDKAIAQINQIQHDARVAANTDTPTLAHDRPSTPLKAGLGPRSSMVFPWREHSVPTRCPSAIRRRTPSISSQLEEWMQKL